eukprot:TRINITY_DN7937_c0_g2_i2.p1 TRINITY_DN7937_c0_g2~~TRINITY_DN7937_c0_g2_i2.p1  ORF type:complete len:153 (-),score=43.06 TRINITY_DN7937_c0_g2_i2:1396-1854(-)
MDFDIFKRFTKHDRFVALEKNREKKLLPEEADALCNRLAVNKNEKVKRIETEKEKAIKDNKKLNEKEGEKLYERLIGWSKNVELKIEAQRAARKKELKKQEFVAKKTKSVEPKIVAERLYADARNRKSNFEYAIKRKYLLENEQVNCTIILA